MTKQNDEIRCAKLSQQKMNVLLNELGYTWDIVELSSVKSSAIGELVGAIGIDHYRECMSTPKRVSAVPKR